MKPEIGSRWNARDGRKMQVIAISPYGPKPYATLRVLNAKGRMWRYTDLGMSNFSDENVSAFLSPAGDENEA